MGYLNSGVNFLPKASISSIIPAWVIKVLQARGTDHRGAQGREALRNGFGLVVAMSWASARGFELRQGNICVAARGAGGVMTVGWAEGL